MRLRLFERLGRLVGWRFGSPGDGSGRPPDPRAARADASGRHRRNAAVSQPPGRAATLTREPAAPPLPPPAGLPKRTPRSTGPIPRAPSVRPGGEVMPPRPRNYTPVQGGGIGRARIREAPVGAAPVEAPPPPMPPPPAVQRQPWYQVIGGPPAARRLAGQAGTAAASAGQPASQAAASEAPARPAPAAASAAAGLGARTSLPFAAAHPHSHPVTADGRRNCGPLESILWRQWDPADMPPPPAVAAIERLAEFPRALQEKLSLGLDGIYVGAGGVPDLDDMSALHDVPLPSGKATWDACAGAYGDRKIVVGTRPSPTPDVMCHEIGHALDDLDSPPGKWQSDSAEFRLIYDQCQAYIASDFHRQRGGLGRKEFFADAFAAIASAQRPALVDMLSGNTRLALRVMLYFNRRYGI
jgi:hypothetical protein